MLKLLTLFLISSTYVFSQNIDGYLIDAIRYSSDNKVVNTRSAGLGFSYLGIVNDQASIQYNPAGLTLNPKSELSFGMNQNMSSIDADYYDSFVSNKLSTTNITNIGISSPIETYYNSNEKYYLGISYTNSLNFNRTIEVNSFNPNNSYTNFESKAFRNWTERTKISSNGSTFVNDSLYQEYKLNESGNMHNISVALATEFGEGLSFGGTMNIAFGSFEYVRFLDETDINSKYQDTSSTPPFADFNKLYHTLEYNQSFTSINFNLGMIYNPSDNIRLSLNVVTPANMRVEEYFYEEAEVEYDNKDVLKYSNIGDDVTTVYHVALPWSLSVGGSYNLTDLTLSTAFQLKDYGSINYLDSGSEYLYDLNGTINSVLGVSYKGSLGAEYDIPYTIFQVRGGVTFTTSPLVNNNDVVLDYSTGFSAFIIEQLRVDFFMQYTEYNNNLFIYDTQNIALTNQNLRIGLGLTYRY